MKQFLKYVSATVVGVFVVGIILTILSILGLAGIAAMNTPMTAVSKNSVLVIQLKGSISERSEDNPFAELLGNAALTNQGLDDIINAIKRAKSEKNVKGIYLEAGTFAGAMPATLEAVRKELEGFKKSGKFIVAYGDTYTQGAYYLCSVADSVIVNPQGMINWTGLSSTVTYYKDLLQKVGVDMQVVKVGTYKSAVEPFLLSEMSDANREQIETYEHEIWTEMLKAVSKSRGVSEAKLNEVADSMALFMTADQYKKMKLVDKIAYSDAVRPTIASMMKLDNPDDYNTVSVTDLAGMSESEPKGISGKQIAVYYAVGDIVEEAATTGFNSESQIVGKTVSEDLQKLADDDKVAAVVLRVNSGGGSAYASEQIWHQVMNIKTNKPIVVSMGDMAASGGYYISCAADYIFAEPTTITGSIGIFGMFPNASELLNNKLGVHFSTVKTNAFSDFGDFSRPFTEQEYTIAQQYVNRGYELFTKRCADGRKMKQDSIKAIGEGRVWTGIHAKKIGLVDELGGLEKAIEKARIMAKAEDASVVNYPDKKDFLTSLMEEMTGDSYADKKIKENLGDYYFIVDNMKRVKQKTGVQVSLPYALRFNL